MVKHGATRLRSDARHNRAEVKSSQLVFLFVFEIVLPRHQRPHRPRCKVQRPYHGAPQERHDSGRLQHLGGGEQRRERARTP